MTEAELAAVVALLGCARAGQRVRYEWVPDLVDRLRFEEMGGHDGDSDGASSRPVMARATAAGALPGMQRQRAGRRYDS